MRIILDTDKKTITVPWNYSDKLEAMNKTIREAMGDEAKTLDFKNYIDDCWKYAMEHSDSLLKTGQKPTRAEKKGLMNGDKSNARGNCADTPAIREIR